MATNAQATFEALREAIKARDADRLLGLYSDDVVLLGYNKNSPPASPTKLEGKASIEPMLRDVFGREMTHELTDEVVGEGRLSYNEHCEYPDGNRVFASVVCDLRDGKIVRQVQQETWDE